MKKFILASTLALITLNCYALNVEVYAHAFNTKGKTKHNTPFHTQHRTYFINDSNVNQLIKVQYKACAQFMDCQIKMFSVIVYPHSTWTDTHNFWKTLVYNRLGKYRCSAETTISGAVSKHELSYGRIEIEKA